jgi:hypothetical protein
MNKLLVTAALSVAAVPVLAEAPPVPYPEGYRDWYHVKSMVIEEGHALYEAFGGIHHIYANELALAGYRSGKFPDGAVIVFDLLAAVHADHAVTEGERKVAGVMHKDAGKYADTGGWGFEGFAAGDAAQPVVGGQAASACFGCHQPLAERDYVFSTLRD